MHIVIFGGKGYLGTYFSELYPDAVTPSVDIADAHAVAEVLDTEKPDVVINCAGKTGRPNVDWCEDHKAETLRSNLTGPLVLLEECGKRGIYWVQIGSGCIYAGDNDGKGFTEDDEPNYVGSFYSKTKLWCDQVLKEFTHEGAGLLLVRPRMPFDGTAQDRNLIMKLRNYRKLIDEPNSMTYIPDLLEVTKKLISKGSKGIYNVVNPGLTSALQIMTLYKEIVDPSHSFEHFSLDELEKITKAGRSNCLLNIEKLRTEGIELPSVDDRVRDALRLLASEEAMSVSS